MEIKKLKLSWSGGRGDSNYVTVPRDIYLQLTLALLITRVQWKSIYEQLTPCLNWRTIRMNYYRYKEGKLIIIWYLSEPLIGIRFLGGKYPWSQKPLVSGWGISNAEGPAHSAPLTVFPYPAARAQLTDDLLDCPPCVFFELHPIYFCTGEPKFSCWGGYP